ncbi:MAG: prepilin-type N-terminal cleavage/methylation domain-containing protein [Chitinivibrionales bacterium]|nr:prepilin-type N-terminal cleavage/methylation domain-containing protein [Chitinivibrionales bacterium]
MKSSTGFSLIETIVVGVIIAILAAISFPLYDGYVAKSNRDRLHNIVLSAKTAANTHFRKTGTHPDSADLNLFFDDENDFEVSVDDEARSITIRDISDPDNVIEETAHY